ncbi:hypothetical protein [Sphingomonas sp. Root241]|uniref:hypothetical protein n=1 Tax=Sphingomonas sp. Root241 TaxID=1736501 RepID=UPI0006FD3C8F|nr:hypothetical protein [Sphingomonas sp. Root241]KRC79786.1 hypothetical protein ASE13_11950 [Sphingomonas sp. Root241]
MRRKTIAIATLVAGTLDIAAAMITTALHGKSIAGMLQSVASGPLGEWPRSVGWIGAAVGLAVHFAIMAVMATAFVAAARLLPRVREWRLLYGMAYGALLYLVMYWIVIPLRWPSSSGAAVTPLSVLMPLAIHILLVGIPIALIATAAKEVRAPVV